METLQTEGATTGRDAIGLSAGLGQVHLCWVSHILFGISVSEDVKELLARDAFELEADSLDVNVGSRTFSAGTNILKSLCGVRARQGHRELGHQLSLVGNMHLAYVQIVSS